MQNKFMNDKKYLSVKIQGGLGNQMFQIATLYGTAYDNNLEPIIEKITESPSIFNARPTYWNTILKNTNHIESTNYNKIVFTILNEKDMRYNKIIVPYSTNNSIKLEGYYQSAKYFEKYRYEILNLFKLEENKQEIITKIKKEIINLFTLSLNNEYVAVHVRRGDYLKLQHFYVLQDMNYYNSAMSLFKNCNFIIFSDDINWCKENFTGNNIFIMDYSKIKTERNDLPLDVLELYLMSSFDHNIIANSSFSWWSAWLNTNKNKKVVAPSKWFVPSNPNNEIKDIYCSDWVCLPSTR